MLLAQENSNHGREFASKLKLFLGFVSLGLRKLRACRYTHAVQDSYTMKVLLNVLFFIIFDQIVNGEVGYVTDV